MVRHSSRIQGTEEARGIRLELRELDGSSLKLIEQGVSAAPGCEGRSSASARLGRREIGCFRLRLVELVGSRLGWRDLGDPG